MPLRADEVSEAVEAQRAAAHDTADQVRVVAGPGTGKSATIEERVCWLLGNGVDPATVAAVSFTRAAARDLEIRIAKARESCGLGGQRIAVTTLHGLALRTLRRAGVLAAYPADPVVLQNWELRNVFEAEFGKTAGISGTTRPEQIRIDHEAYWQTGQYDPPNLIPPTPPITESERVRFRQFHGPRTQLYSCVLPGEVVALCVERVEAGTLDPVELLRIEHLIVDEFQDLNPMDLRFVNGMAERGVCLFVAGDDDQSLYAFRYATPAGIQSFTEVHPDHGDHTLHQCFRCTPRVIGGAQALIRTHAAEGRIEKNLVSLWETAEPPIQGALGCWRFRDGATEARAVAESCKQLIEAGMNPAEIMILLSSTRSQAREIQEALADELVPFAPAREELLVDTPVGRACYAALSIVVEPENYVAHRVLLGIRKGVGVTTCDNIAHAVTDSGRNYRELFYDPLPDGLLDARATSAVRAAASICAELAEWSKDDLLVDRIDDLCRLADETQDMAGASDEVRAFVDDLPDTMSLGDAQRFLAAGKDHERRRVLAEMAERVGQAEPEATLVPDRVQVMTMHGAKGLAADVVFIPGLEESILPGEKRRPYPGLILEAARMLYVSITRARIACALSYAEQRFINGTTQAQTASRFTSAVDKPFVQRTGGIPADLAERVARAAETMRA